MRDISDSGGAAVIGTPLNGYDTRYLKKNLRGHPRRPDEAVPIVAVS